MPIKLDLDINSKKLRDIFLWDANDKSVTPEMFASIECNDFNLNPQYFLMPITESITSQLDAHAKQQEHASFLASSANNNQQSHQADLITIKVDIPIGHTCLTDCFEWDANCDDEAAPEQFAEKTCAELGLGGEFMTCIAYSIRNQVLKHLQSKTSPDDHHFQSSGNSNRKSSAEQVKSIYRDDSASERYGPKIEVMSEEDLQRKVLNVDRGTRRTRRTVSSTY